MKLTPVHVLAGIVSAVLATAAFAGPDGASSKPKTEMGKANPEMGKANPEKGKASASCEAIIAQWPNRPRLAAQQMIGKYGAPLEVSAESLIWHDAGPFKRIMVTKMEIPHDFPKPHMDYLEHTVSFNVPTKKVTDLVAFDASMTINKTAGEMSARCDLEGHNILTLNLARDIVEGKKTVQEARKAFGENVVDDVLGKMPAYVEKLQFEPTKDSEFADVPSIPGSPNRAKGVAGGGDAEVLAFVIAINENEVLAAAEAEHKQIAGGALQFAKTMHTEHGKNLVDTMKLGQTIKMVPADTDAVDALRVKGAGELAELVKLDGKDFERGYLAAMVKGHTEVLAMFDNQLMKDAKNEALKKHLTETRHHVAMHLEMAQKLMKDVRVER